MYKQSRRYICLKSAHRQSNTCRDIWKHTHNQRGTEIDICPSDHGEDRLVSMKF